MSIKLLIIEDNKELLNTYVKEINNGIQSISGDQFIFDKAQNVKSAISKIENQRFDIIIVDLKMPGVKNSNMGGLEVIDRALISDPLIIVIVITGFGSVPLARKAFKQGVFEFIEKSLSSVDELIDAVKRAIDFRTDRLVRAGNPFIPMTGIEPIVFGGRNKELEFFNHKLDRILQTNIIEHFLVLGNWGIGKSTLLKEFKKICQNRGQIVSIVPLEQFKQDSSLFDAAKSLLEGILRELPFSIKNSITL
jgi:DNA-binding NtrC family response regulator